MSKRTASSPVARTRTAIVVPSVVAKDVTPVDSPVESTDDVVIAERIAMAFPDVSVPAFIPAMARAFAMVASMPVTTRDERVAVRNAIIASLSAAFPTSVGTGSKTVGQFSGLHVFESQNTVYVAAAMSGAIVTDGHIVAGWSADIPSARCAYVDHVSYASSTCTDYCNNRHNGVPMVPGARDIVARWAGSATYRPRTARAK